MSAPSERLRSHELNPRVIRPEAVSTVAAALTGTPDTYLATLKDRWIKKTHFRQTLDPMFQVWRIGFLSLEVPVAEADLSRFGVDIEALSSLGPDEPQGKAAGDIGLDPFEGINTMRAFVASAFYEEAARQGLPTPAINDRMIDPPPVKRHQIEDTEASKPGMFLYDGEEFEERWSQENPVLYQETTRLIDQLTGFYSTRMLRAYSTLPADFLTQATPTVEQAYRDYLMEYAVRTYAMLTPNPPVLIEIKAVIPQGV